MTSQSIQIESILTEINDKYNYGKHDYKVLKDGYFKPPSSREKTCSFICDKCSIHLLYVEYTYNHNLASEIYLARKLDKIWGVYDHHLKLNKLSCDEVIIQNIIE